MPLIAVGLNYRSASLDLLERASFPGDLLQKGLHAARAHDSVSEAVIVSTCNRVEIYGVVPGFHAGTAVFRELLSDIHHIDPVVLATATYALHGEDAVRHLFGVACGIDSMVLGEPQILRQVRQAFHAAEAEGVTGPTISALFRSAIRAGRRARSETDIERSGVTFAVAGARLAEREAGGLRDKTVLVLGAGKMSDLAAREMHRMGARLLVTSRTPARAEVLASRAGGVAVPMGELGGALLAADLVVSSTGSAEPVVTPEMLGPVMAARSGRPLSVLDFAVPRDFDPACGAIPGVSLRDLDALREVLAPTKEQADEVARVRAIVELETPKFMAWQRAHRLAPLMEVLQRKAEGVRLRELERASSRLGDLDSAERAAVEALTRSIVAKLLHSPVTVVKSAAGTPDGDALARALRDLFDLEP